MHLPRISTIVALSQLRHDTDSVIQHNHLLLFLSLPLLPTAPRIRTVIPLSLHSYAATSETIRILTCLLFDWRTLAIFVLLFVSVA